MVMTHYMELLSLHQPWFLIIFMLVPMVLAETILAAGIFTLFYHDERSQWWNRVSHVATIVLGIFFIFATVYLVTSYIPTIQWRGIIDYLAVGCYVAAIIPAVILLAKEVGLLEKNEPSEKKTLHHVLLMILFVVFTHFAMVFGMLDPQLAGYVPESTMPMHHEMMDHSKMNHEAMDHSKMDHSTMNHANMDK